MKKKPLLLFKCNRKILAALLTGLDLYTHSNMMMQDNLLANKTVLLVDDDEDMLFLIKKRLEIEGCKVFTSPNGDGVYDSIAANSPDVILLDIQMNGIDGSLICEAIKNNILTAAIPVIMFSANENIESIAQLSGANTFLRKPFNLNSFKQTFSDLSAA